MNGIAVTVGDWPPFSGRLRITTSFGLTIWTSASCQGVSLTGWLADLTQNKLCGFCGAHNYEQGDDDLEDVDIHVNGQPPRSWFKEDFYKRFTIEPTRPEG